MKGLQETCIGLEGRCSSAGGPNSEPLKSHKLIPLETASIWLLLHQAMVYPIVVAPNTKDRLVSFPLIPCPYPCLDPGETLSSSRLRELENELDGEGETILPML